MSADEMCGDYPALCNCDDPETHDGAVTAAGRPSVTDNARDEEPLAWCPGCGDRILTRVVRERGVCSECWGTRDDPWAAGRAETTTATTEDALDSLPYFTFEDDDVYPDEEFVRKADVARLLATARTRPTREQIDRAVGGVLLAYGEVLLNAANHPDPVAVLGRSIAPLRTKITHAVLDLLRDGAR